MAVGTGVEVGVGVGTGVDVEVGSGVAVLVGGTVLVAVGVNVGVTVNVGVRVKVGGRSVGAMTSLFITSPEVASVGSMVATCTSALSVHATAAANAALNIATVAKSATRRIKSRLLSCASILKG